jgi:excisionase family DNA binding protein
MFEKLYTTGEVAKIFGVSYVAVKKWAYSGKIKYIKTPGGKYRYPESERAPKGKVAIYARVSSADQNLLCRYQMDAGASVHPEALP